MGVYLPYIPKLPSEYQEVEYIQSSGTQYIDTGVYINPDYKIEAKYQSTSYVSDSTLFGTRNGGYARCFFRYSSTQYSQVQVSRSPAAASGAEAYDSSNGFNQDVHTVSRSKYYYLDGNLLKTFSNSSSTTSFPYKLYVFTLNDTGTANNFGYFKLYYMKIYNDSGTLVRDFIPCYRKSDGVIGLYDLVNSVFYTNSGTGTFSKGNDVTMVEMKNAYIGEVYEYSYDFRNKNSTILTNDGWSVGANTTIDSNGITSSSYSSTTHLIGHSLVNAKRLTLTCGLYNANGMNSSCGLWATKSSVGTHYASIYIGGYNEGRFVIQLDGAENQTLAQQTFPSGQSEWTYTLDFENLKYKVVYNGVTTNGTMTQTQANNVRNNNTAIRLALQHGTGRMQYVKIEVSL